jgi:hypothetical protein
MYFICEIFVALIKMKASKKRKEDILQKVSPQNVECEKGNVR